MVRGDDRSDFDLGSLEPPPFEETGLADLSETTTPVRPLRPPFERALLLVILAVGLGSVGLIFTQLRSDLASVSWAVTYSPAVLELLAGGLAFLLAMRWSVPGLGGARSRSELLLGAGMALSLIAALAAPHFVVPGHPALCVGAGADKGLPCLGWQSMLGIPVLLAALWLIFRGVSVASTLAGALAGLGAGLVTDGAIHLHCGALDPAHTVPWHFGGVAFLTALGALMGKVIPKR